GLQRREAEAMRQRDFDELFFFAGASDADIQRFQRKAAHLKFSVRPHGLLWSLAVNANLAACVQELRKLFDRAFRTHAFSIALATVRESSELAPACDRAILLTDRGSGGETHGTSGRPAAKRLGLFDGESWGLALEAIRTRTF